MNSKTDIAIVGGGLAGPVLALALAKAGLSVTIIDATPAQARRSDTFDGRGYALALTSQRLLAGVGLWSGIADLTQPILKIDITDGHAGSGPSPMMLTFDHAEIEEGPMGYMLEDRHLRPALMDALAVTDGITVLNGVAVTGQQVNGQALLTLQSGETVAASLVVGADGRSSGTAQRAGIKRTGWDYGQTALVCAIAHEKPHNATAHQFFMPSGPLAILPLPGNRSSIVWTEETRRADEINALPDDAYLEVLRPRFGDFLGGISLAGKRFTYPLNLTIANAFMADRVALVGDAAHGVHPIAGQGLNAGLKDVAALAEVLTDARRRGEDIGSRSVLERYQSWRRFDAASLALATDTFNRLFSNDNPLMRVARDIGLGAVNALPRLRRGLIREAAGLTGEVPRLMRGLPL